MPKPLPPFQAPLLALQPLSLPPPSQPPPPLEAPLADPPPQLEDLPTPAEQPQPPPLGMHDEDAHTAEGNAFYAIAFAYDAASERALLGRRTPAPAVRRAARRDDDASDSAEDKVLQAQSHTPDASVRLPAPASEGAVAAALAESDASDSPTSEDESPASLVFEEGSEPEVQQAAQNWAIHHGKPPPAAAPAARAAADGRQDPLQ
jgi:hypothetical protein